MATREEILAGKTYKEDGLEIERRIFYTLIGEQGTPSRDQLQAHRNSKAIAQIFKILRENGILSEERLDDILLDVVM